MKNRETFCEKKKEIGKQQVRSDGRETLADIGFNEDLGQGSRAAPRGDTLRYLQDFGGDDLLRVATCTDGATPFHRTMAARTPASNPDLQWELLVTADSGGLPSSESEHGGVVGTSSLTRRYLKFLIIIGITIMYHQVVVFLPFFMFGERFCLRSIACIFCSYCIKR